MLLKKEIDHTLYILELECEYGSARLYKSVFFCLVLHLVERDHTLYILKVEYEYRSARLYKSVFYFYSFSSC